MSQSNVFYENTIKATDHELNEEIGDRTLKFIDLECGIFMVTEEINGKVAHEIMLESKELEAIAFKFLKEKTTRGKYSVYKYGD